MVTVFECVAVACLPVYPAAIELHMVKFFGCMQLSTLGQGLRVSGLAASAAGLHLWGSSQRESCLRHSPQGFSKLEMDASIAAYLVRGELLCSGVWAPALFCRLLLRPCCCAPVAAPLLLRSVSRATRVRHPGAEVALGCHRSIRPGLYMLHVLQR